MKILQEFLSNGFITKKVRGRSRVVRTNDNIFKVLIFSQLQDYFVRITDA